MGKNTGEQRTSEGKTQKIDSTANKPRLKRTTDRPWRPAEIDSTEPTPWPNAAALTGRPTLTHGTNRPVLACADATQSHHARFPPWPHRPLGGTANQVPRSHSNLAWPAPHVAPSRWFREAVLLDS